jgi:hypothetical protein
VILTAEYVNESDNQITWFHGCVMRHMGELVRRVVRSHGQHAREGAAQQAIKVERPTDEDSGEPLDLLRDCSYSTRWLDLVLVGARARNAVASRNVTPSLPGMAEVALAEGDERLKPFPTSM